MNKLGREWCDAERVGWTLIILWIHCLLIPETLSKYAEVDQQATPWTTICPVEMNKYEWKSREILMNWVPNWGLNLSQTGGWQKWGDCGSNIKQKLVSAVDTDSLGVWLANDVPNTSGLMQFFRKIRLQSQIRPFLGVRSTNPLSRASGLGKLTRWCPAGQIEQEDNHDDDFDGQPLSECQGIKVSISWPACNHDDNWFSLWWQWSIITVTKCWSRPTSS